MEEREHSVKGGATLVKMREDQDWTYCVLFCSHLLLPITIHYCFIIPHSTLGLCVFFGETVISAYSLIFGNY